MDLTTDDLMTDAEQHASMIADTDDGLNGGWDEGADDRHWSLRGLAHLIDELLSRQLGGL